MKNLRLRDRDAIITREGIILRVYGYTHPPNAYICDPEYAPESIYRSVDPRAIRKAPTQSQAYYKFYSDEGLRFIQKNYPKYTFRYAPLLTRLIGVKVDDIRTTRNPQQKLQQLVTNLPRDKLIESLQNLFDTLKTRTVLSTGDFGVFGSLLHGFYHPQYSDLDLIIYSREGLKALQELLQGVYKENDSSLRNEFESEEAIKCKQWRFENYTPKEYMWHQRRKLIYALYKSAASERIVKTEFEPVKSWKEITNEYNSTQRIFKEGWVRAQVRITDDKDAPFMPSIYQIEPLKIVSSQTNLDNIKRILSYVEEFRMQAKRDETVVVEGNLEKVTTQKGSFHQITLTYGPRYYEQALKVAKSES